MEKEIVVFNKIKEKRLDEIFQSLDIRFSFVTGAVDTAFTQATYPGKCRDFLGDVLWAKHTGKNVSIYGFTYDYKKAPYDLDALKLSLTFPDEGTKLNFLENVYPQLHAKEKEAGIEELTKVYSIADNKETLIVVASKDWMLSPWRLSLYTYYLKIASYLDEASISRPESEYKERLTVDKEKVLLVHVRTAPVIFHDGLNMNHNNAGFFSIITDGDDEYNPPNLDAKEIFGKGVTA